VDHALVSYYFGSKEGLFKAVAELNLTPAEVLDVITNQVSKDQLGRALLEAALATWDRPDYREGLAQLIGDSLASPIAQRTLREYLHTEMVTRLAATIGGANASKHAAALATIIAGLFFTRYVLKVEPIASMSRADVIRHHIPAINAILRASRQ
jgi:transcriptional regulator, tetR family